MTISNESVSCVMKQLNNYFLDIVITLHDLLKYTKRTLKLEKSLWMEVGDYNAFCARMAIIMLLILLSCPIMRERERERERGIQFCDMADGTISVGTVTFDSWIIPWVLKLSSIYGRSTTWVSSYVPQRRRLCILLLEYWVQCLNCLTSYITARPYK